MPSENLDNFNVHNLEESFWADHESVGYVFPQVFDDLTGFLLRNLELEQKISAIDVGSGPFGVLNSHKLAHKFEIVNLDPLRDIYGERLQVELTEAFLNGHAEDIPELLPGKEFELVFSRNALDHSQDIVKALQGCLSIVSKSGLVFIELLENEAVHVGYTGMHLWNCQVLGSDVLLWNPRKSHLVSNIILEQIGSSIWMQSRKSLIVPGIQSQPSIYMWFTLREPDTSKTFRNFVLDYSYLGGIRIKSTNSEAFPDLMFLQIYYQNGDSESITFRW